MTMTSTILRILPLRAVAALAVAVPLAIGTASVANADEADAKRLLKNMSDYLDKQGKYSFEYDSILGVVTAEGQGLELTSSGEIKFHRPNKLHATRAGGFVDIEMYFSGEDMTVLGKDANVYAQIAAPGSVDQLVDVLQTKYNIPLPASDLILTGSYGRLMEGVIDVKDLGSGVINGVECDYLAFRTEEVDWQIWIAQGDKPFPCRFVITSTQIEGQPQYSVQLRNWKTHEIVPDWDFSFKNSTKATKVELADMQNVVMPENFKQGDAQ